MSNPKCKCSFQQLPLTLLFSAFITTIIATASSSSTSSTSSSNTASSSLQRSPLSGTIDQPEDDLASNLTILVATANDGSIIETAPVISRKSFTLHKLAFSEGRHHITVIGSTDREYNTIIATIRNGLLNATFSRSNKYHALVYPSSEHIGENSPTLHFYSGRRTDFDRGRNKKSWTPWNLFMMTINLPSTFWNNKFYVFGALAIIFLLWFPHIFHKLPQDMREELTGEKEPDLGDPNKVIKALLGDDAFSVKRDVPVNGAR